MVRMPAFGLDGPWRDRTGFAQTMEAVSGLTWRTGSPIGPRTLVLGACDPVAGMHAAAAALLGLARRDETGEGLLVESVMVEAALNVAAEALVEYSATGTVLGRQGNRGPDAAPQGVYRCAGDDAWVALAVEGEEHWAGLVARSVGRIGRWTNRCRAKPAASPATTNSTSTSRPGPPTGRTGSRRHAHRGRRPGGGGDAAAMSCTTRSWSFAASSRPRTTR